MEQLKGKLSRKKASDDEEDVEETSEDESEDEESSEESSSPTGLAKHLPFLAKFLNKKSTSKDADDETETDVKPSKGKAVAAGGDGKRKLIWIVIALGGAYFAFDTFMGTDDLTTGETTVTEAPAPKKRKNRKPRPGTEAASTDAEAPATTPEGAPAGTTPPAVTEPSVADIPEVKTDDLPTETPIDTPAVEIPNVTESVPSETVPAKETPDTESSETTPSGEGTATDQVTEGGAPANGEDMTDQILQDLEKQIGNNTTDPKDIPSSYILPPNYEYVGRGLVYNCIGKHWACVDAPSYKVCQQNHKALTAKGRSKECYPDSIYDKDSACTWVQSKKTSQSAKTDFCN